MAHKIKLSCFLILSILGISLLPVIGYAILSLDFFEKGLDTIMEANLVRTAQEFAVTHADAQEGLHVWRDAQIALRWEDMQALVRGHLDSPPEPGRLYQLATADDRPGPPREIAFLMRVPVDGRDFFVRQITTFEGDPLVDIHSHETLCVVIDISLALALALFLFSHLLVRKVTRPVSALSQWAASLDAHGLAEAPPDFVYPELNSLAARIRSSMLAERETMERERRFLRYSSHELRTPISVVCASTEYLIKIVDQGKRNPERENRALKRLERAGKTMTHLVETLLWLSRNSDAALKLEMINLEHLVREAFSDARKFYGHRDLKFAVETHPCTIPLQTGAAEIVIGNIIRNAFQHTLRGVIHIRQTGTLVEVTNYIAKGNPEEQTVGFGLGLELTRRLTTRFGWKYEMQRFSGYNTVSLHFTSQSS